MVTSTSESLRKTPGILIQLWPVYVSVVKVWHFNLTVSSLPRGAAVTPAHNLGSPGPVDDYHPILYSLTPKRISIRTTAGILNRY